jgi:hypothetical protein
MSQDEELKKKCKSQFAGQPKGTAKKFKLKKSIDRCRRDNRAIALLPSYASR